MAAKKSNSEHENINHETDDARIGYQTAIDLWTNESEQSWARFNAMLVANSAILAVIGLAETNSPPIHLFSIGLSFAGLFLCGIWLIIIKRGFDYQNYYVMSAREIEERFLANTIKTVSRGGTFADGQPINIIIDGKPKMLRMSWCSRIAKTEYICIIVICIFMVIYFAAFAFGVIPFICNCLGY
jgi:hypothetical protein